MRNLTAEPLPPLQSETILVPGQGIARWLQLRLAERCGIAAGLRLPFFGAFLQELASAGHRQGPDLFGTSVLVWRLWRLLGATTLREELGAAGTYCHDDPDGQKRFQLCRRLAACFDDYQLYRDDVLLAFANGDDKKELGPHAGWQAHLWRALLQDAGFAVGGTGPRARRPRPKGGESAWLFPELAPPSRGASTSTDAAVAGPAHRIEHLRRLLRDPVAARAILPSRLSVFGAGTLPPAFVQLLQQMAAHVPVHLYVPQPTAHYVGDLRSKGRRVGDHTLLARLGTEAREFADLLVDLETSAAGAPPLQRCDLGLASTRAPMSLLHCLQQDIVAAFDRGAGTNERFAIDPDDDSLRVHDCHSQKRELEVVRDQILAAFADDDALRPHDVLVLVPDIDRYAPYAHAVFGPVKDHLPFHVADRNPKSELPICAALLEVLQLGCTRLHAFDVLHLLEEPAVQRRFQLVAADLPVLRHLCDRAGIRWGVDGAWRAARFAVPPFDDNAWLPGLQRLLLGAMTGPVDELVAGRLPVGDVTEGRTDLLVRFVTFVHTLFRSLEPLHEAHALDTWALLLDGLVRELFAPQGGDDDNAIAMLRLTTARLRQEQALARHTERLSPSVFRDWLTIALQQSSGSRGFLGGAVTVAAMLPMRTVPVRCLFVCGLDDTSFPRRDQPAPFDLIAAERRPGDRSRRLDDRQMFLDVLLAARDRLHLTFVGHSAKDNAACTPSVVLTELLDHVDRTCVAPAGWKTPSDFVRVPHPLQPWSRRYRDGADPRLFTFARHAGAGAAAVAVERPWFAPGQTISTAAETEEIPLDVLVEFWWHPCRFFLQHSLRVRVRRDDDREDETEPFTLHGLDKYQLQDGAVRRVLRGEPSARDPQALAAATGRLPVGAQGTAAFAALDAETQQFLHAAADHGAVANRLLRARGAGFTIVGDVEGLGAAEMFRIRCANLKPKDKLRAWILHLVVAAARAQGEPLLPLQTRILAKDATCVIAELNADFVASQLAWLVLHYRRGLQAPLLFFEKSSHTYGEALYEGKHHAEALRAARRQWAPDTNQEHRSPNDSEDAHIQLCMRGRDPLAEEEFAKLAEFLWAPACSYLREVDE